MNSPTILSLAGAFMVWSSVAFAEEAVAPMAEYPMPAVVQRPENIRFKHSSFTFVRIRYTTVDPRRAVWVIDYPDADLNFTEQFQQVTGLQCEPDGLVLELTDPILKQHPFIFITEGSQMRLTPAEVDGLRAYLLGGGFLMLDDSWGEEEWSAVAAQLRQVLPDREPVDLPLDHPVFRCFYDIRTKPQVPSIHIAIANRSTGATWERPDAKEAHYRGLFGDDGRLMVLFCHNTDLADGWERVGKNDYYSREFSQKRAFPMGINIVVHALTR